MVLDVLTLNTNHPGTNLQTIIFVTDPTFMLKKVSTRPQKCFDLIFLDGSYHNALISVEVMVLSMDRVLLVL